MSDGTVEAIKVKLELQTGNIGAGVKAAGDELDKLGEGTRKVKLSVSPQMDSGTKAFQAFQKQVKSGFDTEIRVKFADTGATGIRAMRKQVSDALAAEGGIKVPFAAQMTKQQGQDVRKALQTAITEATTKTPVKVVVKWIFGEGPKEPPIFRQKVLVDWDWGNGPTSGPGGARTGTRGGPSRGTPSAGGGAAASTAETQEERERTQTAREGVRYHTWRRTDIRRRAANARAGASDPGTGTRSQANTQAERTRQAAEREEQVTGTDAARAGARSNRQRSQQAQRAARSTQTSQDVRAAYKGNTFGCPEPGCNYWGTSEANLKTHRDTKHKGDRPSSGAAPASRPSRPTPPPATPAGGGASTYKGNTYGCPEPGCRTWKTSEKGIQEHIASGHHKTRQPAASSPARPVASAPVNEPLNLDLPRHTMRVGGKGASAAPATPVAASATPAAGDRLSYPCTEPGCPHLPFVTQSGLTNHQKTKHAAKPAAPAAPVRSAPAWTPPPNPLGLPVQSVAAMPRTHAPTGVVKVAAPKGAASPKQTSEKCTECGDAFSSAAGLGRHMESVHGAKKVGNRFVKGSNAGKPMVKCPECGHNTIDLAQHKFKKHGIAGATGDAIASASAASAAASIPAMPEDQSIESLSAHVAELKALFEQTAKERAALEQQSQASSAGRPGTAQEIKGKTSRRKNYRVSSMPKGLRRGGSSVAPSATDPNNPKNNDVKDIAARLAKGREDLAKAQEKDRAEQDALVKNLFDTYGSFKEGVWRPNEGAPDLTDPAELTKFFDSLSKPSRRAFGKTLGAWTAGTDGSKGKIRSVIPGEDASPETKAAAESGALVSAFMGIVARRAQKDIGHGYSGVRKAGQRGRRGEGKSLGGEAVAVPKDKSFFKACPECGSTSANGGDCKDPWHASYGKKPRVRSVQSNMTKAERDALKAARAAEKEARERAAAELLAKQERERNTVQLAGADDTRVPFAGLPTTKTVPKPKFNPDTKTMDWVDTEVPRTPAERVLGTKEEYVAKATGRASQLITENPDGTFTVGKSKYAKTFASKQAALKYLGESAQSAYPEAVRRFEALPGPEAMPEGPAQPLRSIQQITRDDTYNTPSARHPLDRKRRRKWKPMGSIGPTPKVRNQNGPIRWVGQPGEFEPLPMERMPQAEVPEFGFSPKQEVSRIVPPGVANPIEPPPTIVPISRPRQAAAAAVDPDIAQSLHVNAAPRTNIPYARAVPLPVVGSVSVEPSWQGAMPQGSLGSRARLGVSGIPVGGGYLPEALPFDQRAQKAAARRRVPRKRGRIMDADLESRVLPIASILPETDEDPGAGTWEAAKKRLQSKFRPMAEGGLMERLLAGGQAVREYDREQRQKERDHRTGKSLERILQVPPRTEQYHDDYCDGGDQCPVHFQKSAEPAWMRRAREGKGVTKDTTRGFADGGYVKHGGLLERMAQAGHQPSIIRVGERGPELQVTDTNTGQSEIVPTHKVPTWLQRAREGHGVAKDMTGFAEGGRKPGKSKIGPWGHSSEDPIGLAAINAQRREAADFARMTADREELTRPSRLLPARATPPAGYTSSNVNAANPPEVIPLGKGPKAVWDDVRANAQRRVTASSGPLALAREGARVQQEAKDAQTRERSLLMGRDKIEIKAADITVEKADYKDIDLPTFMRQAAGAGAGAGARGTTPAGAGPAGGTAGGPAISNPAQAQAAGPTAQRAQAAPAGAGVVPPTPATPPEQAIKYNKAQEAFDARVSKLTARSSHEDIQAKIQYAKQMTPARAFTTQVAQIFEQMAGRSGIQTRAREAETATSVSLQTEALAIDAKRRVDELTGERNRLAGYRAAGSDAFGKTEAKRLKQIEAEDLPKATDVLTQATQEATNRKAAAAQKANDILGRGDVAKNVAVGFVGLAGATVAMKAAFTALNLALETSSQAVADFAETQMGFVNKTSAFNQSLGAAIQQQDGNTKAVVGSTLALSGMSKSVSDAITPFLSGRAGTIAGNQAAQSRMEQTAAGLGVGEQGGPLGINARPSALPQGFDRNLVASVGGLFGWGIGPGSTAPTAQVMQEEIGLYRNEGVRKPSIGDIVGNVLTGQDPLGVDKTAESFAKMDVAISGWNDKAKEAGVALEAVRLSANDASGAVEKTAKVFDKLHPGLASEIRANNIAINGGDISEYQAAEFLQSQATYTPTADELAKGQERGMFAQERDLRRQRNIGLQMDIPAQQAFQLMANPLLPYGAKTLPQGGAAGNIPNKNLLKGVVSDESYNAQQAAYGKAFSPNTEMGSKALASQKALTAEAEKGRDVLRAWGVPESTITQIESLGKSIQTITRGLDQRSLNLTTSQYTNQIRLASRAWKDAKDMAAAVAGHTRQTVGGLEGANLLLGRQSQLLSFGMEQRSINYQVALAGFVAPGDTPEERQARVDFEEKKAEYAQKQLNIQKQMGSNQFTSANLQIGRSVQDAAAEIALLKEGRSIAIETAAANEQVKAMTAEQSLLIQQAQEYAKEGRSLVEMYDKATLEIEARTGKAFDKWMKKVVAGYSEAGKSFGEGIMAALVLPQSESRGGGNGSNDANRGRSSGSTSAAPKHVQPTTSFGRREVDEGKDLNYNGIIGAASGFLGNVSKPTNFTVGEVANETVAVLRNPRSMPMGGFGGGGGGGGTVNVNININGGGDIDAKKLQEWGAQIQRATLQALDRKTSLLGLRQPN